MSASDIEICNLGLAKFGDKKITTITAPTCKEERECKVLYPLMRDTLTSSHPWNFAMKRADITGSLTTTPAFGWDYAYTLPADCLRVWEFSTDYTENPDFEIEGGLLLTDEEEYIYIRYLYQVTETGKFPMAYVNCLATLLGAELAPLIMGSSGQGIRTQLMAELEQRWLPMARRLNAIEGRKKRNTDDEPLDEGNYTWQTEGR
jgi:hypothetical protein